MRIDIVAPLVYALVRKEKDNIHKGFLSCIANEKEGRVRTYFKRMYDEYKSREGMAVVDELDYSIRKLVCAPYRDCTFDDLMLSGEIRESTDRILLEWKHKDVLLEKGLAPVNKLLLAGPPGNGKTSYAVALSKELGLPLLNTSSSLMLDSHMGESEKNVSTLFRRIPEECVLFVDEFESMASSRGDPGGDSGGAGRAWNSIVTAFLVHMESLRPSVFFLAATNRPDMLDKAIIRRFDMKLEFENPTSDEKIRYIQQYADTHDVDVSYFAKDKISRKLCKAVSYSAVETILKRYHKELVLDALFQKEDA